jgi:hypothetical protein
MTDLAAGYEALMLARADVTLVPSDVAGWRREVYAARPLLHITPLDVRVALYAVGVGSVVLFCVGVLRCAATQ